MKRLILILAVTVNVIQTKVPICDKSNVNRNIQDTVDKTKYYRCDTNENLVKLSCPEGYEFDPVSLDCVQQKMVEKYQKSMSSWQESVCINQDNGIRIANFENDCRSYFECDNQNAVEEYCATGLLYDPENDFCNYPEDVICICTEFCPSNELPPTPPHGNPTTSPATQGTPPITPPHGDPNNTTTTTTTSPPDDTETTTTICPPDVTETTTTICPPDDTETTTIICPPIDTETTTTICPPIETTTVTYCPPPITTCPPCTTTCPCPEPESTTESNVCPPITPCPKQTETCSAIFSS